ncbi:hypothetical protein LINPERHAP1_LOCUS19517, partial [Linum perenne]
MVPPFASLPLLSGGRHGCIPYEFCLEAGATKRMAYCTSMQGILHSTQVCCSFGFLPYPN